MERLSTRTNVRALPYERTAVTPGIVHLGVGAFSRAHLAVYIHKILAEEPEWGIIGASLRRADTKSALEPQDFLFTVVVRDAAEVRLSIIGSLLDVIDATAHDNRLLDVLTAAETKIVTLTVTEKGYCHNPATGELDLNHPDILHDIAYPERPRSAVGFLVRALEIRRRQGRKPFTVLSCDNLPSNGRTTRTVVGQLAAQRSEQLAEYILTKVEFPSSMVDRIVPATTSLDQEEVRQGLGLEDAWPVVTEPFSQWVVEDRFGDGRPALERVGVELVTDVAPFELMKLRMLNGSHSTLAYAGYLSGYAFVSEAVRQPVLHDLIHRLMSEEVIPTLPTSAGDAAKYRDALLKRFANPAIRHKTWQIAMDGSQKLPQRILGTLRDRLASGASITYLSFSVAAWMRYVSGPDELGAPIDVQDPMLETIRGVLRGTSDPGETVGKLLGITQIFGALPEDERFRKAVTSHFTRITANGILSAAKSII